MRSLLHLHNGAQRVRFRLLCAEDFYFKRIDTLLSFFPLCSESQHVLSSPGQGETATITVYFLIILLLGM